MLSVPYGPKNAVVILCFERRYPNKIVLFA